MAGRQGRKAHRPIPAHIDETYEAPLPAACPDCGGPLHLHRQATQSQEDLPVVRPIVRVFHVAIGHCRQCGRRVQGRHPLQTSDALGAASAQLGSPSCLFLQQGLCVRDRWRHGTISTRGVAIARGHD